MGFNKVYNSLQEIFPQIDARVLRAVAIEHSKDADAAVEAVLGEIIPFFTERSRPSSHLPRSISMGQSSKAIATTQTVDGPPVNPIDSAEEIFANHVNDDNHQYFHDANDGHNEPFYNTYGGQHEGEGSTAELTLSENCGENSIKIAADVYSHGNSVVLKDENEINILQSEVSIAHEREETISADKSPESGIQTLSDKAPYHTLGTLEDVDMGVTKIMNLVQEREDFDGHIETYFGMATSKENDQGKSCVDDNYSVGGSTSGTVQDLTTSESSGQLVVRTNTHESNIENSKVSFPTDTASKMGTTNDTVGIEDESSMNDTVSQSRQTYIMNVLEEIIANARNNKKTLFSAMESVISMMREVELKEQLAEQSKEEAARGGTDVQDKVEELKQMLQHAKEANNMHAGEVYGEKAILSTELRELQSRVLFLSDERDKSLAVLDEMRQTLEVRLAAAEDEIKSAEKEKLGKQKSARKELADQEMIMERVVKESNILKQQAEENAKLREFLVDRGCVVDTLQGEIAVICQDVKLLKENFDERVPLSKSLSSSQTSCILASSSSSLKSLIPDQVEPVPDLDDSIETGQKRDPITQVSVEEAARFDHKALLEEGWDIFEKFEINE